MILRAAIVFLLVLNLGVAAWWISGGNAQVDAAPAAPSGAIPGLRLVAEADTKPPAPAVAASAADSTPPAPELAASPAPTAIPAVQTPAAPPVATCLRFGPFADAATRDGARQALAAFATTVVPRDSPGRSARGWKVHIPPFPTREQAVAMAEKIKAAGISDMYVMNQGGDANSIALGRYGSEEAARRREADLRAKGFAAQALPLGDAPSQWWLDARLATGADQTRMASIAASRPLDCATLR